MVVAAVAAAVTAADVVVTVVSGVAAVVAVNCCVEAAKRSKLPCKPQPYSICFKSKSDCSEYNWKVLILGSLQLGLGLTRSLAFAPWGEAGANGS